MLMSSPGVLQPWAYVITQRLRAHWENGPAERLIGSIRRECPDHIVVFGDTHLRRILVAYTGYYDDLRTHLSLDEDSPNRRPIQRPATYRAADSRRTSSSLLPDLVLITHRRPF
jgi:hypothetical protein